MENINPMRAITNKEVQLLISRKERQARRLLKRIRQKLGKVEGQDITIADFCQYKGYNLQHVCHILSNENKKTAN
jgi:hypothetical protein